MRVIKTVPGAVGVLLLLGALLAAGLAGVQVHRVTHPVRRPAMSLDLGASIAKADDVTFAASDRVPLTGWLLKGAPGRPGIVLAHDLGESKSSMMSLAVVLNHAGFTVLAFDFRGHGGSSGSGSTLGIEESRDVLGAVDFLAGLPPGTVDTRKLGVYGRGMGAHAAVLAAAERGTLRVLVLDSLWPDARWTLVRLTFEEWPWGAEHLGALPSLAFTMLSGTSPTRARAEDVLPALGSRDVLLVASSQDPALAASMKSMYDALPESRDAERGLVTIGTRDSAGLQGAELAEFHARIVDFFRVRLARP